MPNDLHEHMMNRLFWSCIVLGGAFLFSIGCHLASKAESVWTQGRKSRYVWGAGGLVCLLIGLVAMSQAIR